MASVCIEMDEYDARQIQVIEKWQVGHSQGKRRCIERKENNVDMNLAFKGKVGENKAIENVGD